MNDELNPYPGNLKHHKLEPLLSDEQVLDLRSYPPEEIRDIYEAARAKDAEVREAAAAVIAQWDTPNWKLKEPTGALIERLRKALDQ